MEEAGGQEGAGREGEAAAAAAAAIPAGSSEEGPGETLAAPAQAAGEEHAGAEDGLSEETMTEEEAAAKQKMFHRRKPSWFNESHPLFVWGDDATRKKIMAEYRLERASVEGSDSEEDDDDVDDDDMKYGLDPGFTDIDEELRAIEGMISEHTVIREVEVDDDHDDLELDEQVSRALQQLRIKSAEEVGARADAECVLSESAPGAVEGGLRQRKLSVDTEVSNASAPVLPQSGEELPGGIDGQGKRSSDVESVVSGEEAVGAQAAALEGGMPPPSAPRPIVGGDAAAKAGGTGGSSRTGKARRTKRVRLVELPDYLAMVAREHQRQLLEKQRRDLQLAAQAANARESSASAANVGPRSQNRIRRGYFDRLGIAGDSAPVSPTSSINAAKRLDMGINARRAAIASARTRRRPPNLRVKLRESASSSKGRGFFKKLASWMSPDTSDADSVEKAEAPRPSSGQGPHAHSPSSQKEPKQIGFAEVADVYFIPARSDYPAKIKHAIWHTRAEFVDMVMTNMDQVELEMQQEADARRRLKDLRDNPPPGRR